MTTRTIATSALVPLLMLGIALTQLAIGGNSLPSWLATLSIKFEFDDLILLRALIAIELAIALFCLTMGGRAHAIAWLAVIGSGFVSLAECSASLRRDDGQHLMTSGIIFLISLVLAGMLARKGGEGTDHRSEETEPTTVRWNPRRTVVQVIGMILIVAVTINIGLSPRTLAEGRPLEAQGPDLGEDVPIFTLSPDNWSGKEISEIQLTTYVPELLRLTEDGRSLVVIYNKGCGDCHDMFEVHFSEGFHVPVIAIEVPPAEGAVLAPGRREDDVTCRDCVMTSLPEGPMWLITPPVMLLVEDGRILCVESEDYLQCLEEA